MSELKASKVVWKRLRNVLITAICFAAVGSGVGYAYFGGRILLDADGMITRNRISVSAPLDSRIKQVYVRPGDFVRAGQKVATVEIGRDLALAGGAGGGKGAHRRPRRRSSRAARR